MKILITGATGLIGSEIRKFLITDGHQIVVLSRRPASAKGPASATSLTGLSVFQWEPEAELPPPQSWEGVDAVIHLAGESVASGRWTDERKKRIRNSRVKGTRNLVAGMRDARIHPKIFISGSAVGYYGDREGEILTENSKRGSGFLSEVCMEWEAEAARARELGVRVALVRTGVVLSPTGGALEKMLAPFKLGLGGRMGDGRQWFPWIHLEDIAGIFRHALMTDSVDGPVNGVSPGIVTNEEFTRELAAVLHRPVFFPVPVFALRLLMGEMADAVLASQRVVPRVPLATGYQFQRPYLKSALESLLRPGQRA
jgi:uncharacterized protein (TIGR01777 family)